MLMSSDTIRAGETKYHNVWYMVFFPIKLSGLDTITELDLVIVKKLHMLDFMCILCDSRFS